VKSFSEWEVIKERLEAVTGVAFTDRTNTISEISLSRSNARRKIEELDNFCP
jgi:hypothetical protein